MKNRSMDMEHCSLEVKKGIKWLENYLTDVMSEYKDSNGRLDVCRNIGGFYTLYNMSHPLASKFIKFADNKDFWSSDWLLDDPHKLYYLARMGLDKNKYFKEIVQEFIKDKQTIRGFIHSNTHTHVGPMRVLFFIEPESEYTKRAVEYFIQHCMDFDHPDEISIGILALYEYDFYRYSDIIRKLSDILKKKISENGYIKGYSNKPDIEYTCLAIQALSHVFGSNNKVVRKSVEWLKENQNPDDNWNEDSIDTSLAILSLISIGEGPKISKDKWEQKELLYQQKLKMTKSNIVVTSPFSGEFEIKNKIKEMINNTNNRLWICSRFITEFWTDLISLKKDKPEIDMKIITIPKKEAKEKYIGHGKKFVEPAFDTLQRFLENNFRTTPLLHARYIIADDTVLVSSADLTSEQLEKEFNLGIWTRDPETVQESVGVFENLWKSIVNEKD